VITSSTKRLLGLTILVCAWAIAGCDADVPSARTEALDETAPTEETPEVIGPPAHAALPSWVPSTLRASIETSRLPVMLPREPAMSATDLATGTVLHMDRWVSTRIETTTYIATIFGTDAHHEPPRGAPAVLPDRQSGHLGWQQVHGRLAVRSPTLHRQPKALGKNHRAHEKLHAQPACILLYQDKPTEREFLTNLNETSKSQYREHLDPLQEVTLRWSSFDEYGDPDRVAQGPQPPK
jgi:hypothetical protein